MKRAFSLCIAASALCVFSAWAFARVPLGGAVENVELAALDGARTPVLSNATANVFVFVKPGQENSRSVLTGTDGEIYVDTGAFRVKVPAERMEPYKPYKGKQVIFGLRPENLHDPEYAPPGIHQAVVVLSSSTRNSVSSSVMSTCS